MIYKFINNNKDIVDVWIPITGNVNLYNGEDGTETGVWKRYWDGGCGTTISRTLRVDPYSRKDFANATDKKMTMGEMWDLSKEMSESRAQKDGVDKVKEKNMRDYEKNVGVKHQDEIARLKKEKAKKSMEKMGFGFEE